MVMAIPVPELTQEWQTIRYQLIHVISEHDIDIVELDDSYYYLDCDTPKLKALIFELFLLGILSSGECTWIEDNLLCD